METAKSVSKVKLLEIMKEMLGDKLKEHRKNIN